MSTKPLTVTFSEVSKKDIPLVGGKGANLGEMIQASLPIPNGFIVTAAAYFQVIKTNELESKIKDLLNNLDVRDTDALNAASAQVEKLIKNVEMPASLKTEILDQYHRLGGDKPALVAARSSATAEDLPGASFAGQQETYLNVLSDQDLLEKVKLCWASLFEPRAIFYRQEKGFDHFKVGIAVPVQRMVQSDVAGIMFTINPVTNDVNQVVIEAIYGLGEKIVQGAYTPDHYLVQKNSWKLLQSKVNEQQQFMTYHEGKNQELPVPDSKRTKQKLDEDQIISLAQLGHKIQEHYKFPQDIEWAMENGEMFIVQSRPVTTITEDAFTEKEEQSTANLTEIVTGEPASPGIISGKVKILKSSAEISSLKPGEILVTDMTTPDFVPAMKKAAAIITNQGGQTSHAAIVSRELGIPCVVGTETATTVLKSGQLVTVNGKTGSVFEGGEPPTDREKAEQKEPEIEPAKISYRKLKPNLHQTKTNIYVNLAEPDLAAQVAQRNVDGVGLLRAEFMIAEMGTHPRKLIKEGKEKQFIQGLADGMEKFVREFHPRPVVYRATDFKTNEYANLEGGAEFEQEEPNPMIGYRGASRYIADDQVFQLELEAIRHVREDLGYDNLWLMIPFVRTVQQLKDVKHIVNDFGLRRGPNFNLWMMVEIPSNVILLEEFLKVGIDGISIGSNDLTMLLLGVDRDNSKIADTYDEMNPAVIWALEKIVTTCKKHNVTASICGQAPSLHPQLSKKLVEWGITSVSVTPDMIEKTREVVHEVEKELGYDSK